MAFYEYRRMPPATVTSIFGRRLREARIKLGVPQDRLGVLAGLEESSSSARMSRYESGVHQPSLQFASAVASALNVPLAYLYCDDGLLAAIILLYHELPETQRDQAHRYLEDLAAATS